MEEFAQGKVNLAAFFFFGERYILQSVPKTRLIVRTSREAGKRSGPKLSWLATVDLEMLCISGRFSFVCTM